VPDGASVRFAAFGNGPPAFTLALPGGASTALVAW